MDILRVKTLNISPLNIMYDIWGIDTLWVEFFLRISLFGFIIKIMLILYNELENVGISLYLS